MSDVHLPFLTSTDPAQLPPAAAGQKPPQPVLCYHSALTSLLDETPGGGGKRCPDRYFQMIFQCDWKPPNNTPRLLLHISTAISWKDWLGICWDHSNFPSNWHPQYPQHFAPLYKSVCDQPGGGRMPRSCSISKVTDLENLSSKGSTGSRLEAEPLPVLRR